MPHPGRRRQTCPTQLEVQEDHIPLLSRCGSKGDGAIEMVVPGNGAGGEGGGGNGGHVHSGGGFASGAGARRGGTLPFKILLAIWKGLLDAILMRLARERRAGVRGDASLGRREARHGRSRVMVPYLGSGVDAISEAIEGAR